MKKITTLLAMLSICMANAQAYKGKGDIKAQVAANFQSGANGIHISSDFGIGENMSYGFSATYLLSASDAVDSSSLTVKQPEFGDRIDAKARFNANLGNVFKLDPKMDIYPGLDLGLRNFGAHAGFRYFFTDGFGVFGEAGIPIAKYNTNLSGVGNYNNQFTFNIGASFNL